MVDNVHDYDRCALWCCPCESSQANGWRQLSRTPPQVQAHSWAQLIRTRPHRPELDMPLPDDLGKFQFTTNAGLLTNVMQLGAPLQ